MQPQSEPEKLTRDTAHELKQPLNITKIICQSLLNDIEKNRLITDELKNDLLEIVNQMNRASEIIERIREKVSKERNDGTAAK